MGMLAVLRRPPTPMLPDAVAEAVVETVEEGGWCSVHLCRDESATPVWARIALPGGCRPGDRVLVSGDPSDCSYVIGSLESRPGPEAITASDGSSIEIAREDDEERLRVRDAAGQVLFEYRPGSGKGVLSVPDGDLELRAPSGGMRFVAAGDVRLHSDGAIALEGNDGAQLAAGAPGTPERSALRVDRNGMELRSQRVGVSAERAELAIEETELRGTRLTSRLEQARVVVGKLETVAERLVEKAVDVFRTVEKLHQLRAGRVRTIAEGSVQVKGERMVLKGEKDVQVQADKINLG